MLITYPLGGNLFYFGFLALVTLFLILLSQISSYHQRKNRKFMENKFGQKKKDKH